jgi:hypothetical protein
LLGDVVDFRSRFQAVGRGRREEVVGQQLLRTTADTATSVLGKQHDADLEDALRA